MRQLFGFTNLPNLGPRYNIAPGQEIAVVRSIPSGGGGRELSQLRWGLVPAWAKDPAIGYKTINARSESAAEKPSFRDALRNRRCLIPADGFYEWQKHGQNKQAWYISPAGGDGLAFAGLWERWTRPDNTPLDTCTILTTDATPPLQAIHHRMPVILSPGEFNTWLEPESSGYGSLLRNPKGGEPLALRPVSSRVNSVSNDDAECSKAISLAPAMETPNQPRLL